MSTVAQRSFSGGEISPSLYARVDTSKYTTGLRTCRNMLVMRHGGAQNRPGTTFIGEIKDSTKTVRLIPFVFNTSQTYMLEFGDFYMRVIQNAAQVVETAKVITAATVANPCVISSTAHGFSNGDEVFITGIVGMNQLNGRNFKVAGVTANTFNLQTMIGTNLDSSGYSVYTSGGTAARVYTITTPYAMADLPTLRFIQSADVVTIVHPNYAPQELKRTGTTAWTITPITFAPVMAAPTGVANNGTVGTGVSWVVTAISADTKEESLTSTPTVSNQTYARITWTAVTGAGSYNIYRLSLASGIYGFVGNSITTTFDDNTGSNAPIPADYTKNPPNANNPFPGAGDYPSTAAYIQQRLSFANTNNNPEKVWLSRSGRFKNFTSTFPTQDDDSVTFRLAGRQVNAVQHIVDLGKMISMTTAGEWAILGDTAGTIKPGVINPKQYSYNGSSSLAPIVIDSSLLYVQARGSVVRDLGFDFRIDGYQGNELTIFSSHLVDNYTLVDWTFQKIPQSIVWAARSDGVLLGMTYVKEQQILAWHRHDFDGTVENVCSIPEGTEDAVYLVIKRTVNGSSKRYIERLASRKIVNLIDSIFMDCALSYDGRNTNTSNTMTLSGGTTWVSTETLTLTANYSAFVAGDVGKGFQLTGSDGTLLRFTITGYTSATVVTGTVNKTVPAAMQGIATSAWTKTLQTMTGLWHLEGKSVSVFADNFVTASPNNASYVTVTVSNGTITLDKLYGVIHVGLPITADIETLNMDTPQPGQTLADKKKDASRVTVFVENTRGLWAGPKPPSNDAADPLENLVEYKVRNLEKYDSPIALKSDTMDVIIPSEWNSNGRVFLRQIDPVPVSVLAVAPAGMFPFNMDR